MQVKFKIGNSVKKLTVRLCKPDGQCLFEALWFQTAAKGYDYNEKAVKEFKDRVLQFIENDEEYYRPFIENHLADFIGDKYWRKYINASDERKKRMRDKLMKSIWEGKEWGASETIVAVRDMYNVNCVSFNENNGLIYMPHYQKAYDGIILVTFKNLNHYDTVMDMNQGDIPNIAKELAKRII